MKRIPKTIYGNKINLAGIYSNKTLKLTYFPDLSEWYASDGNFCVRKLGLQVHYGYVTFASLRKQDVALWTKGALSAMRMVSQLVNR